MHFEPGDCLIYHHSDDYEIPVMFVAHCSPNGDGPDPKWRLGASIVEFPGGHQARVGRAQLRLIVTSPN
jgi:hypothetical protein